MDEVDDPNLPYINRFWKETQQEFGNRNKELWQNLYDIFIQNPHLVRAGKAISEKVLPAVSDPGAPFSLTEKIAYSLPSAARLYKGDLTAIPEVIQDLGDPKRRAAIRGLTAGAAEAVGENVTPADIASVGGMGAAKGAVRLGVKQLTKSSLTDVVKGAKQAETLFKVAQPIAKVARAADIGSDVAAIGSGLTQAAGGVAEGDPSRIGVGLGVAGLGGISRFVDSPWARRFAEKKVVQPAGRMAEVAEPSTAIPPPGGVEAPEGSKSFDKWLDEGEAELQNFEAQWRGVPGGQLIKNEGGILPWERGLHYDATVQKYLDDQRVKSGAETALDNLEKSAELRPGEPLLGHDLMSGVRFSTIRAHAQLLKPAVRRIENMFKVLHSRVEGEIRRVISQGLDWKDIPDKPGQRKVETYDIDPTVKVAVPIVKFGKEWGEWFGPRYSGKNAPFIAIDPAYIAYRAQGNSGYNSAKAHKLFVDELINLLIHEWGHEAAHHDQAIFDEFSTGRWTLADKLRDQQGLPKVERPVVYTDKEGRSVELSSEVRKHYERTLQTRAQSGSVMERAFRDAQDIIRHNPVVARELENFRKALMADPTIFKDFLHLDGAVHGKLAAEQTKIDGIAYPKEETGGVRQADAVSSVGERKDVLPTTTPGQIQAQNVPIVGVPTHFPVTGGYGPQYLKRAAEKLENSSEFQEFGKWINEFIDAIRPHVATVSDPTKYPKTAGQMSPLVLQRAKMTQGVVDYSLFGATWAGTGNIEISPLTFLVSMGEDMRKYPIYEELLRSGGEQFVAEDMFARMMATTIHEVTHSAGFTHPRKDILGSSVFDWEKSKTRVIESGGQSTSVTAPYDLEFDDALRAAMRAIKGPAFDAVMESARANAKRWVGKFVDIQRQVASHTYAPGSLTPSVPWGPVQGGGAVPTGGGGGTQAGGPGTVVTPGAPGPPTTVIIPGAPTPGGPIIPGTGYHPKKKPDREPTFHLSRLRRTISPQINNVKRISMRAGMMLESFLNDWERSASRMIAFRRKLCEGLTKQEDRKIVDMLRGKLTPDPATVDQKLISIYEQLRDALEITRNDALAAGVKVGYWKNYFPRFWYQTGWNPPVSLGKTTKYSGGEYVRKAGHLERARKTKRQDYIKTLDILDNYFNEAYKRTSEVRHLGKGHDLYYEALIKSKPKVGSETASYLKNAALRITGNQPDEWLGKYGSKVRHIQALSDLGLAALYQPGQIANTVAYGGLLRSARALKQLSSGKYNEQFYKALRSSALSPDITMEIIGRTKQDLPLFKNKKVQNFMYGIGTLDEFMRVHAYTVGEMMLSEAKAGNRGAVKELRALGLDTTASPDDVGLKLSHKTQYQTSSAFLPQWATTDWGKMLFQYKNFMYRHGIFVKQLFKDAAHGNIKPLARFLGAGAIAGEVVADIRELIKGRPLDPEERDVPWDTNSWEQNLLAATRNRRIPWSHPIMRLLQNYAMLGGAGIMQSYLESAGSPVKTLARIAGGPVFSNVEELVADRLPRQGTRGLGQWALRQIPVYGYDIQRKILPDEPESQGRHRAGQRTRSRSRSR